jgi:iron complex transport system substrate-binding protein
MRIVCLSAEAADICARLGAWNEVVAVSAFADQRDLPRKPVVSGFANGDVPRVLAFEPDLVITFSDVQADLAAQLIRAGVTVLATNQRTLANIAQTIQLIGRALGRADAASKLAADFESQLEALRPGDQPRPRVYFEEWPDPLISGIGWVGDLIGLAGGVDVFASRRGKATRERHVTAAEVAAADPEIILASWCGKPVDLEAIRARAGFAEISAVRDSQLFEIASSDILQPGPRVLRGAREIARIIAEWRTCKLRSQLAA